MGKINDLTGKRFGRLVALEYMGRRNGRTLWRCQCDCGSTCITGYSNLMNGITKSCGCLGMESRVKTGHNNRTSADSSFYDNIRTHPLYGVWSSMLTRCYNAHRNSYKHYGGRGIVVCDRWLPHNLGFQHFVEDMGARPTRRYTLDRIDVNGDYSPENCRWATTEQQANNKTDSVIIYYKNRQMSLKQVCDAVGLNYSTVAHQVKKGFDINMIIEQDGVDFRRKGFRGCTDKYKNFNRKITIFVSQLDNVGTELVDKED